MILKAFSEDRIDIVLKIYLPHGYAEFDSDDFWNYIIQGQQKCIRREQTKPILDCWLRDNFARNPGTKQAVNEVVDALLATADFKLGRFKCPDSGIMCKGIELLG